MKQKTRWKCPKKQDAYWYLVPGPFLARWTASSSFFKKNRADRNIFATEAEALAMLAKIKKVMRKG